MDSEVLLDRCIPAFLSGDPAKTLVALGYKLDAQCDLIDNGVIYLAVAL